MPISLVLTINRSPVRLSRPFHCNVTALDKFTDTFTQYASVNQQYNLVLAKRQ